MAVSIIMYYNIEVNNSSVSFVKLTVIHDTSSIPTQSENLECHSFTIKWTYSGMLREL